MPSELHENVRGFVTQVVGAMGLSVSIELIDLEDGSLRVDVKGEGSDLLLHRKGEGLDALQHLVNTAYRRDLGGGQRIVVDAARFRELKDLELQQMARFLMEKAKGSGLPQEIGPLNSYSRRVVHLEVARDPDMTSESQGDGAMKLVIIAPRSRK
jgi:spoIIIJ-associated protein